MQISHTKALGSNRIKTRNLHVVKLFIRMHQFKVKKKKILGNVGRLFYT